MSGEVGRSCNTLLCCDEQEHVAAVHSNTPVCSPAWDPQHYLLPRPDVAHLQHPPTGVIRTVGTASAFFVHCSGQAPEMHSHGKVTHKFGVSVLATHTAHGVPGGLACAGLEKLGVLNLQLIIKSGACVPLVTPTAPEADLSVCLANSSLCLQQLQEAHSVHDSNQFSQVHVTSAVANNLHWACCSAMYHQHCSSV